jgi:hypothetical protein
MGITSRHGPARLGEANPFTAPLCAVVEEVQRHRERVLVLAQTTGHQRLDQALVDAIVNEQPDRLHIGP